MSFLSALTYQVDKPTRTRGAKYFAQRRVKSITGDDFDITAQVRGASTYDVEVYRDEDALVAHCSCPLFDRNREPCKHIWAALLQAEHDGLLNGNGSNDDVFLDTDHYEDESFIDELDDDGFAGGWQPKLIKPPNQKALKPPPKPALPQWQKQLNDVHRELTQNERQAYTVGRWNAGRQLLYVVEIAETLSGGQLYVTVPHRERKQNGDWSKPKLENIDPSVISQLPDPEDRAILALFTGARPSNGGYLYSRFDGFNSTCRFFVPYKLAETVIPLMCRTGRCFVRPQPQAELEPLTWDDSGPWSFCLKLARSDDGSNYHLSGLLRRGVETAALSVPYVLVGSLIVWPGRISLFALEGSFYWVTTMRRTQVLTFPADQKAAWLEQLLRLPDLPRLELPEDLQIQEIQGSPRPRLLIEPNKDQWRRQDLVLGRLSFDYAGRVAKSDEVGPLYVSESNQLIRRDGQAEKNAFEALYRVGFTPGNTYYEEQSQLQLKTRQLPKAVATLLAEGWHVEAHGKLYRRPGRIDIEVATGIDWFELRGDVDFDGAHVGLPELLSALKKGENTVVLGDGSLGMLPEDWLKKYGLLAGLGKAEDGHLKFRRNQAGLLDALLAAQPEARCDAAFVKVREELRAFEGIEPVDPPADFQGTLRGYQREGLGWLHFLHRFGFGGCLADDMGLGKTVQVLALLDARRRQTPQPGPNLVVVPKSLVFNWKQEAARFTPDLRILDHTGGDRLKPGDHFQDYDLILTTYGILRRDALEFKDRLFDYCVLDEAQAIKNAKSESAKACRLLQANHRLAVTGTPVENHLGELWSLFEFLNPGMLGQASVFQLAGIGSRNPEPETRTLLAKALRPFLLRRTKEQVAKDLPPKTEQTLYAEMEPAQRKVYDELRDHYRQSLLAKVAREGIAKSKIQILEALLRLRQAACHPGLIDKNKTQEPSAKLDLLLPQLAEVLDEGHKVLIFSQFVAMLTILRQRLDQDGIVYEYLDGRTRHRGDKVERFQTDPACKLFLISLKAGGLGLNLTAADYVFLLDPWWNPAVEAQAIDRTHRIGQTSPVFAYRLIVKDTVEEKVLALQSQKRALADAILNADNSLIRTLGREDLELLLS